MRRLGAKRTARAALEAGPRRAGAPMHAIAAVGCVLAAACGGCDRAPLPPNPRPVATVVVVTFDGVRPHELFVGPDPDLAPERAVGPDPAMPFLLNDLGPRGAFVGRPGKGEPMVLANPVGTSLPGYQSMFAGRPTLCLDNECGAPEGGTLFDAVLDARDGSPGQVTILASWDGICEGLGLDARFDATCGPGAIERRWMAQMGGGRATDAPSPPDSVDRAAFELALDRLAGHPPALLFLALDETDGTGHAGDYPGHLRTLARYDTWLRELDETLRDLEEAGHPSALVVTTDHGRGSGEQWSEHRWNVPGTRRVWLFASGRGIRPAGAVAARQRYTLASLRATVEYLLGIEREPSLCEADVIEAILVETPSSDPDAD